MKKAIIGIFCLSLAFALAGWGCTKSNQDQNANTAKDLNEGLEFFEWENVNQNANLNENTNADQNENLNLGVEGAEIIEEDKAAAEARDTQRLAHIRSIQSAIEKYKADRGHYPDSYDQLIPGYLTAWPANPTPGGADYVYTPIGSLPAQYYDLSYELEVGVESIIEGVHVANPDGIAVP